jgi:hypothetical protein
MTRPGTGLNRIPAFIEHEHILTAQVSSGLVILTISRAPGSRWYCLWAGLSAEAKASPPLLRRGGTRMTVGCLEERYSRSRETRSRFQDAGARS